jgi:hypothetical protein
MNIGSFEEKLINHTNDELITNLMVWKMNVINFCRRIEHNINDQLITKNTFLFFYETKLLSEDLANILYIELNGIERNVSYDLLYVINLNIN